MVAAFQKSKKQYIGGRGKGQYKDKVGGLHTVRNAAILSALQQLARLPIMSMSARMMWRFQTLTILFRASPLIYRLGSIAFGPLV
jgi:hypothetical protein